jgi:hypothetical protein
MKGLKILLKPREDNYSILFRLLTGANYLLQPRHNTFNKTIYRTKYILKIKLFQFIFKNRDSHLMLKINQIVNQAKSSITLIFFTTCGIVGRETRKSTTPKQDAQAVRLHNPMSTK